MFVNNLLSDPKEQVASVIGETADLTTGGGGAAAAAATTNPSVDLENGLSGTVIPLLDSVNAIPSTISTIMEPDDTPYGMGVESQATDATPVDVLDINVPGEKTETSTIGNGVAKVVEVVTEPLAVSVGEVVPVSNVIQAPKPKPQTTKPNCSVKHKKKYHSTTYRCCYGNTCCI